MLFVDKSSKIYLYYIVLSFRLAIYLKVKDNEEFLFYAKKIA